MAKYNMKNKEERYASYRNMVNPQLMDELQAGIEQVLVTQKKYRDRSYCATKLAKDLDTNTRYISAVVNTRFHMSYTSLVNKYRVEESMTMLLDRRYFNLNMSEISEIVGFNNRQSFYAAFYRVNGMTPREYRMEHVRQVLEAEGVDPTKTNKTNEKK